MSLKSIFPRSSELSRRPRLAGPTYRALRAALATVVNALVAIAIVAIALAAVSGARAESYGIAGRGASGIQIINLGAGAMGGSVRLWPQGPAGPIDIAFGPYIAPDVAANIYLPAMAMVPPGAYALVSTSDEPSGSLAANNWLDSSAATVYTAPDPGLDIIAPYVAIGHDGQNSIVSIQNTDATVAANVTLTLTEADSGLPAAEAEYLIPPSRSISVDLARISPFAALAESGFVGALRINSTDVPVAVHVLTDASLSVIGAFDYEGLRSDAGAATLHVPRFRVDEPAMSAAGELRTSVAVANPGLTAVDVSIAYTGESGSCAASTATSATRTLPPGSMTLFDDAEASGFSSGCAGYSTVQATGGSVSAVVIHREFDGAVANEHAAHRAIAISDASTMVHLPFVRNRQIPGMELMSEFIVTNPGAGTAEVVITRFDDTGAEMTTTCAACGPFSLSAGESVRFVADEIAFPEGEYGSVRLDADSPIAATLFDIAIGGGVDTSAHTGILGGVSTTTRYHPVVFNSGDLGAPTPTPTSTSPATAGTPPTPAPTSTPPPPVGVRGLAGAGASGIHIQNADTTSAADIVASFQLQGGGAPVEVSFSDIAPRSVVNFFLPSWKDLANGIHALVASSDQTIGVMARTDWFSSGSAILEVDAQSAVDGALVVPFAAKAYDGRTSYITVENTDADSATNVLITVNDPDGTEADSTSIELSPGASKTIRLSDTSMFSALPASFFGSVVASADVPIAAHVFVEDTGFAPRGVFDATGLVAASAADRLVVPRFSNAEAVEPGILSTWIAVMNPGGSVLQATVHYSGERGTCVDTMATSGPITLQPGGMTIFDPAETMLPAGCGGSAFVESSSGGVLAYAVHDTSMGDGRWSAAHPAFRPADQAEEWLAPVFRRRHIASLEMSTELTVFNPGDTAANITLQLLDNTGTPIEGCTECSVTIEPNSSHIFVGESISVFLEGTYGSAVVQSGVPVVVLLQEFARSGMIDSVASSAIVLSSDGDTQAALPFIARGGDVETDPPPPGPSATPSPLPSTSSPPLGLTPTASTPSTRTNKIWLPFVLRLSDGD